MNTVSGVPLNLALLKSVLLALNSVARKLVPIVLLNSTARKDVFSPWNWALSNICHQPPNSAPPKVTEQNSASGEQNSASLKSVPSVLLNLTMLKFAPFFNLAPLKEVSAPLNWALRKSTSPQKTASSKRTYSASKSTSLKSSV